MLTPVYPHGTDPSIPGPMGSPLPLRHTTTAGVLRAEGCQNVVGRMFIRAGLQPFPANGMFTVANNDFSERVVLHLGEHKLISNIDFTPGVNVNATATAVANAINGIASGFLATVLGPVVGVQWGNGPIDEVDFRAVHHGAITNFTPFAPADGFLQAGRPSMAAPLLA